MALEWRKENLGDIHHQIYTKYSLRHHLRGLDTIRNQKTKKKKRFSDTKLAVKTYLYQTPTTLACDRMSLSNVMTK